MADDTGGPDSGAGTPPTPPPDQSPAVSATPSPGGGTLAPQGAAGSQPVAQLGMQAMAKAQMKLIVHALHTKISPAFSYDSEEGKAIQKALKALAPFAGGGDKDGDKNSAMASLMQRALAAKAQGGGQMPQPNRGPIPTMAGTQ